MGKDGPAQVPRCPPAHALDLTPACPPARTGQGTGKTRLGRQRQSWRAGTCLGPPPPPTNGFFFTPPTPSFLPAPLTLARLNTAAWLGTETENPICIPPRPAYRHQQEPTGRHGREGGDEPGGTYFVLTFVTKENGQTWYLAALREKEAHVTIKTS